mmetsp:Transcript_22808/g.44306  ORF Transcript_22808/g.44306 Transcript_22808/m.44306 type:complete len:248 (-) Transcript_22808:633-1376(-)
MGRVHWSSHRHCFQPMTLEMHSCTFRRGLLRSIFWSKRKGCRAVTHGLHKLFDRHSSYTAKWIIGEAVLVERVYVDKLLRGKDKEIVRVVLFPNRIAILRNGRRSPLLSTKFHLNVGVRRLGTKKIEVRALQIFSLDDCQLQQSNRGWVLEASQVDAFVATNGEGHAVRCNHHTCDGIINGSTNSTVDARHVSYVANAFKIDLDLRGIIEQDLHAPNERALTDQWSEHDAHRAIDAEVGDTHLGNRC